MVGNNRIVLENFRIVPMSNDIVMHVRTTSCDSSILYIEDGMPVSVTLNKTCEYGVVLSSDDAFVLVAFDDNRVRRLPVEDISYRMHHNEVHTIDDLSYAHEFEVFTTSDGIEYVTPPIGPSSPLPKRRLLPDAMFKNDEAIVEQTSCDYCIEDVEDVEDKKDAEYMENAETYTGGMLRVARNMPTDDNAALEYMRTTSNKTGYRYVIKDPRYEHNFYAYMDWRCKSNGALRNVKRTYNSRFYKTIREAAMDAIYFLRSIVLKTVTTKTVTTIPEIQTVTASLCDTTYDSVKLRLAPHVETIDVDLLQLCTLGNMGCIYLDSHTGLCMFPHSRKRTRGMTETAITVEDTEIKEPGVVYADVEDADVEDAGVEDAGVEDADVVQTGVEDSTTTISNELGDAMRACLLLKACLEA